MYARITAFRIKPEAVEVATAKLEEMKPAIAALPGLQHFIHVVNDDGNGYVISLIDDATAANPPTEKIQAIWAQFGEYLAAPPEAPMTYRVLANFTN